MGNQRADGLHKRWRFAPVLFALLFLFCALWLYHILFPEETAPPGSDRPLTASADNLLKLFEDECLKEVHREWLRTRIRRHRDFCESYFDVRLGFNSKTEIGCLESLRTADWGWTVPGTSKTNIAIHIEAPLDERYLIDDFMPHFCSVSTDEKFDPAMQEKYLRLKERGGLWADNATLIGGNADGKNWRLVRNGTINR